MRLDDQQKERLRTQTMEVLLAVRAQFLARYGRAVMRTHWDRLLSAMRGATDDTHQPEEWVTYLTERLQLESPSKSACSAMMDLVHAVRETDSRAWRDLVQRESALILVMAQQCAEQRREERNAKNGLVNHDNETL